MKSITEILGGAQLLFSLAFDLQETFEEYLNDEHRAFLALLRVIEGSLALQERVYCGRGRIPYHDLPFFRAFLAKAFLQIPTTEKLTERKVTYLYSLMDATYDATDVRVYIEGKGRVALIDQNRRRGHERPPMDPAHKQRFKIRSTVERANSHLKDWFFSGKVYVRGIRKVRAHLMIGVVCLAAVKILQHLILPQQEKEAA
ncbi:MAG: transposase [Spirochaetia bacterium]|jgi:hypothetical protein